MARIKYAEEDHDQSNVLCEELKAEMKVTVKAVGNVYKVLQKERYGKGGSYPFPKCMVQLILEQLMYCTLPEVISPNIASQDSLDMPGVKVIVQELPRINFIRSCLTILQIICENLSAYCIGKVEQ